MKIPKLIPIALLLSVWTVSPVLSAAPTHPLARLAHLPTEESVQRNETGLELTSGKFDTKYGLTINETLLVDGLIRKSIVHLPKQFEAKKQRPLVIVLHGAKLSGWIAQTVTGFDRIANDENFIVAYPDAIHRQWDDGRPEGFTPAYGIDDVKFISTLIDYMIWKYNVDPEKVYVTGYSSGGMLTQKLGLELTDKIAAMATVAASLPMAQLNKNEKPSRPISLLMINGSADKAFPWNGGNTRIVRIRVGEVAPVLTTYDYWINANEGVDEDSKKKEESLQKKVGGTKVEFINTRTENGACVLLYKINGGGHTWPGSEVPLRYIPLLGRQSRQMNASELIWEFFKNNKDDCQT